MKAYPGRVNLFATLATFFQKRLNVQKDGAGFKPTLMYNEHLMMNTI